MYICFISNAAMVQTNEKKREVTSSFFKLPGLGTSSIESLKKQELVAGRWIIVKFCKTRSHVISLAVLQQLFN